VLYGLIEFVPFDTMSIAGVEAPRALVWLGVVLLLNTALIVTFFKELRIVCFDPALATTMGISATLVHYGLMTSVAVTSVASFESVGSILVVAMLVAPGATANLLTDRFGRMLWISTIVAALSAVLGYIGAVWLNTSVAGMIATTALGLFVLAVLLAPRHGVIAKRLRRLGLSVRICREDMLGLVYRWHEATEAAGSRGAAALPPVLASDALALSRAGLLGRAVLAWLVTTGVVLRSGDGGLRLTTTGLGESRRIVRGHRLWETYLAKRAGVNPAKVHAPAHATEHFLTDDLRSQLDEDLGEPHDPHGRVIP
jgi:manganese/zinc/iron transport system permease protein